MPLAAVNASGARISQSTGNADARRRAVGTSLEMEHEAQHWRYCVFARRDELKADRTLLNAAAFASGTLMFDQHSLNLGVGAHYSRSQIEGRQAEPGIVRPGLNFLWHHRQFHLAIAASEKLTHSELAILLRLVIPFEVGSDFEYIESQPYRWSSNIFAHVSKFGGLIVGFEPVATVFRAGAWFKPTDSLSVRTVARLPAYGETFLEFSAAYQWELVAPSAADGVIAAQQSAPVKPKQLQTGKIVPAFATLVKWGLTPVAALRLSREKNICALDAAARAVLARHHWECQDAR